MDGRRPMTVPTSGGAISKSRVSGSKLVHSRTHMQTKEGRLTNRLVGQQVRVPCAFMAACTAACRATPGHRGVIAVCCADKCLVHLEAQTGDGRTSQAPEISGMAAMRWAAMASRDAVAMVPDLQRLRVVGEDTEHMAAPAMPAGTESSGRPVNPVTLSSPQQVWHPTWRVRKWLLPADAQGEVPALCRSAGA